MAIGEVAAMNNSSANNVLLKSLQPSAAQASVARRNYQDDQSSSFQQHFQDVRESARAQIERASKSTPKKVAAVDNPKSNNDVEKRRSVSAQESPEKRVPEKVKVEDKNARAKYKITEQAPNSRVNESADSEALESTKRSVKKSDAKNSQDNEQNSDITNLAVAPAPTALKDSVLPTDVIAAGVTNVAFINESDVSLPSAPIASAVIPQSPIKSDTILAASPSTELMPALPTQTESADQSLVSDADKLATKDVAIMSNQQAATDLILTPLSQQAATAISPENVTDQSVTSVAAGEAEALLKSPATQLVPSGSMEEDAAVSDDEVSASPVPATLESAIAKTSSKTTGEQGQATDPNQKQNSLLESKVSFEKALQNMVVSESAGRDTGTPSATLQNSPATNSSPLDSMFRFSEANTPSSRGFVVQTAVPVPVGQPQWSQAVGEKVLWLAAQNVSSAEINLNPEHLGPVQVKVSVNQEQTSVSFTSHHAVVREVLDQNLGRLRDMFSEQGLNLVNVDVSDKSFSRQQGDAQHQSGQGTHKESSVEEETPVAVSLIKQQRLVDHYA